MRQFDAFICPSKNLEEPFTDCNLRWFSSENFNDRLNESEAEWIVFASKDVILDRTFFNDLAVCIESFPMIDAFAPRICTPNGTFLNAMRLDGKYGVKEIEDDKKLKFVAAPQGYVAAFSRRIVQRTGRMDNTFAPNMQLLDFSLRMLHAGGRMFFVPYLVINASTELLNTSNLYINDKSALLRVLYKSLGIKAAMQLFLHNVTVLPELMHILTDKNIKMQRDKAIDLSKLSKETLKEIQ